MSTIDPKTLKGFRDFLPDQQITRQRMIETIRASYEAFGFEPLETPALEYAEILTGKYGDEGDKLMYRFKDNGDRDVALRYDLTIPLARVVAQYGDIKKPFKRYQISPVWRAENTQKGRFREFYQCDADIAGSSSALADAEILALAANTLRALGIRPADFVVRVNSREIIAAFYDSLDLSDTAKTAAIRAVDKIDKIGRQGVSDELRKSGLSGEAAESILAFADTSIDAVNDESELAKIGEALPSIQKPLAVLADIIEKASVLAPDARFVVDFSIARGLDYYTGMIFETTLASAPQYGSVLSGGRYDNLVGMFANKPVPAVGASIGLDRLFAALEELKLVPAQKTVARAIIVNFDESLTDDYLALASELRVAGVNTILYFDAVDIKKQLSYASDRGIRYALIYGANEAKSGKVMVKNLETGDQREVLWKDIAQSLV
ncbi:MAG: histidine--tRNA ligase [Patescibacteria group bacterium]|nr:histidine--tRNA ligase [Patescibacteria group bacterium]MDE2116784.1 histidine--tRNA ligase [Patescibacteria group bacterium]